MQKDGMAADVRQLMSSVTRVVKGPTLTTFQCLLTKQSICYVLLLAFKRPVKSLIPAQEFHPGMSKQIGNYIHASYAKQFSAAAAAHS